ncbi:MAG: NifU family protein [Patescibacteria group bacterium]|jgi:Fe-S cluster biogenesis protein NfuA
MNKEKTIKNIKSSLDKIRPALQGHGGDVEFVDFDEKKGIVKVKMQGHCVGCPMAQMTLKQGIEEELKQAVSEVKEVEAV